MEDNYFVEPCQQSPTSLTKRLADLFLRKEALASGWRGGRPGCAWAGSTPWTWGGWSPALSLASVVSKSERWEVKGKSSATAVDWDLATRRMNTMSYFRRSPSPPTHLPVVDDLYWMPWGGVASDGGFSPTTQFGRSMSEGLLLMPMRS